MPQDLSKEEQWEKLQIWLRESIAAIERGDLERLPASWRGEKGRTAIEAYRTCQEAMRFLENWEQFGLPRHRNEPQEPPQR